MLVRQVVGDIALAVLIALPTVVVAHPQPLVHKDRLAAVPLAHSVAMAERAPLAPHRSLLG